VIFQKKKIQLLYIKNMSKNLLNETFKKHLKLLHEHLNINESNYDAQILDNGDYKILAINDKDNPLDVKVGDIVPKGKATLKQYYSDGDYFKVIGENLNEPMSIEDLAKVSDEALDNAYHYGRSTPGNTFGWQANLKSAEFAKRVIDAGVTDIEKISDAIHSGWNETAKKFVANPDQFSDTQKLRDNGKFDAKIEQRRKLSNVNYSSLPEEEKEKDRVVARALLNAIQTP